MTAPSALEISHGGTGDVLLRWLDADGNEVTFTYAPTTPHTKVSLPLDAQGVPTAAADAAAVAPLPGQDTTPSWFTVRIGFVQTGTDPDTVKLALRGIENLNVRLTQRGQAPFDASIVDVAKVLYAHPAPADYESKQGFAFKRWVNPDDFDAEGPEEFAPYADVEAVEVY